MTPVPVCSACEFAKKTNTASGELHTCPLEIESPPSSSWDMQFNERFVESIVDDWKGDILPSSVQGFISEVLSRRQAETFEEAWKEFRERELPKERALWKAETERKAASFLRDTCKFNHALPKFGCEDCTETRARNMVLLEVFGEELREIHDEEALEIIRAQS